MSVDFIIYSAEGMELGSGTVPTAEQARAQLTVKPEGSVIYVLPNGTVGNRGPDGVPFLAPLRAHYTALIDAAAEAERLKYITAGYGQAMTYLAKSAEARAFMADPQAVTPFLSAEAEAMGATVAEIAAKVSEAEAAWRVIGGAIESVRMASKAAVAAAATLPAIVAAAEVEWPRVSDT